MSSIDVDAADEGDDARTESDSPEESHDHTVDVEAVDHVDPIEDAEDATGLPDQVDAPDYVLYGGKGGVGKTTMAASTALASAAAGTATLVVSTDPAHSLSDTLDVDVPAEPTRIREDIPLYAAEIDPDSVVAGPFGGEGGPGAAGSGAAGDAGAGAGFGSDADASSGFDQNADVEDNPFAGGDAAGAGASPFGDLGGMEDLIGGAMGPGSMPGADEAAAMQQLMEYLDDPRFDRVVVDTAPTGHTLRLLELPELMDSMVGRIAKFRQQFSGMMEGVKGMFGMGNEENAAAPDLDELRERIERLRTVLRDPAKTDFRVVMIPEEMSVVESERLVERLDGYGIPVQTLVVNRVMEDLAEVTSADVDDRWVVSPDLEHCEFCQRRWQVQQDAIGRATELFRSRDVKRVPLLAEEVRGERALRVVAACLE
ncbi:ArsA family ATPase [Halobellus inordinatus]|uniref:ArsA family ATPase n=1 Tax=Halobellus inordinatus TaxID=1126236 RepID=UPI0021150B5E|nr:TRC40/GET3/ArsA family transport-energizing ATPase [Halobellus ramosii]